ncbi:hypothetical protein [Pseudomonas sp.]|uniref:hypothetical protein n=1 Tax=Pseudomonas sp. TaxID=306 RepID=UPI003FD81F91
MQTTTEYSVCQDCLMFIAYGDEPDDGPDLEAAMKREIGDTGGHFSTGIAPTEEDPDGSGHDEFSRSSCELCNSTLGGSRHGVTLIIPVPSDG